MKRYPRHGRRAVAALALLGSLAASAAPKPPSPPSSTIPRYGVLVYSDLCFEQASGEIGGQRITLHRFAEADTVIYEFTAGSLSWPLVASDVNLDPRSGAFYFTVGGADSEQRTIGGKFSANGQSLTLEGGYCADQSIPIKLTRVKDFGAELKACKPCPAPKEAPQS